METLPATRWPGRLSYPTIVLPEDPATASPAARVLVLADGAHNPASATALAFIFPAACYLKLKAPGTPWYTRTKLPAVVCAAFGVVVLCISLFLALGKAWTPAGKATICMD